MRVTGSLSCDAVYNCYLGCRAGDQSCIRGCIDQGTEEAQDDFSEMLSCMEFDCRRDPDCYGNTCKVEMRTCLGEQQGPAPNSLSCGGALTCLLRCNSTSLQCRQGCTSAVRSGEANDLYAIMTCLSEHMCQGISCINDNCLTEYTTCSPPGMLTCAQILTCAENCSDQYCVTECHLSGTVLAQRKMANLAACLERNMCSSFECIECQDLYGYCLEGQ